MPHVCVNRSLIKSDGSEISYKKVGVGKLDK